MPFPFTQLPEHLRLLTVQKQDLSDFLNFHVCSRNAYETSNKLKTRFAYEIRGAMAGRITNEELMLVYSSGLQIGNVDKELLPSAVVNSSVRIVVDEFQIGGKIDELERLTDFFRRTKSSVVQLGIAPLDEDFECSPDQFNDLIEASNPHEVRLWQGDLSPEYLKIPALAQISFFSANSAFTDIHLSALVTSSLLLDWTEITNVGINSLLKEWLSGKREIWSIAIHTTGTVFWRSEMFEGIPFAIVKCEQLHTHPDSQYSVKRAFLIERQDGEKIAVRFISERIAIVDVNFKEGITILE